MTSVNLGSVPDWFAGGGAVLALFFARRAVKAANNTNQQQGQQLAKLEEAEERRRTTERQSQASNIAVWLELDAGGTPGQPERWRMVVRYSNVSCQPIYELRVRPRFFEGKAAKALRIPVVPPTSQATIDEAGTKVLTDDLQQHAEAECSGDAVSVDSITGNERVSQEYRVNLTAAFGAARDLGVDIEFFDGAGVKWNRNSRGRLSEVAATAD